MERPLPSTGQKSTRFPHLGVWVFGLGPKSPVPSDRLKVAILDETGRVVRRFEQVTGMMIDEGYVDYFLGPNCRPAVALHPIIDIDRDGKQTTLLPDYTQAMGMALYLQTLERWATTHGKPEYALP